MGNDLKTYILLTPKNWHDKLFFDLQLRKKVNWVRIKEVHDFTIENVRKISPDKIFIPHWSNLIPSDIYLNYECVVFHMTDLPYGRGGSPLQNLIVRGHKFTKISALKVTKEIDAGDIYLKSDLALFGTAYEIFLRASTIIFDMINSIIEKRPKPTPQAGEVERFSRRKASESNVESIEDMSVLYDYIRMLDCDGYPFAYIENTSFKFEFINAQHNLESNEILANVRILKK
jgi:methionyl-tRNA formyltransferase